MIKKDKLIYLYLKKKKSMQEIAVFCDCSLHKIQYWINKYNIKTRSISEAVYLKNNPDGDPFVFKQPKTLEEAKLYGLGVGLYWGEGTKADKGSVRLGNTDPELIKNFINFLINIFSVKKEDMKFGLQLFTDINKQEAMDFWIKSLKIKHSQFYNVITTKSRSIGTYRKKSKYGVLTVYYHNKKLRDLIVGLLPM